MGTFLREWQAELKRTLTGSPDALPDWSRKFAQGEDPGYFLPGSAVWAVHGGVATIVGGIRSLLMQTLHPAVLAGVHDHSNFRQDTLGRLARTTAWIHALTYGSTAEAQAATGRVGRLHESVNGKYVDGGGNVRKYSANDPELLRWVHITFTDSFLRAHELWGGPIPGGPDAYVREWAQAGRLMGVEVPPESKAALNRELGEWLAGGTLRCDERVAETVAFIRNPPLHPLLKPGYRVLFEAAVLSLEPGYRRLLGLRTARLGPLPLPVRAAARVTLAVVRSALGPASPSQLAARERLQRLGVT
ncbi:oxygenase MpaB family protein [uncultured Arthrobacter sp.]|uniref:oxygenase MpaB family protein n=1 Tax=uncultured Arthrobacter sp. TaxID=114050 RepID=UPI0028D73200|nr:oxygenase MpaB family protein [uncultured Arthrobacter sp.]